MVLIDKQLTDKIQTYIANSPDFAISAPIQVNDLFKVLNGLVTAERIIIAETDMLQAITNNYKQIIQILEHYQMIDQQTIDNFGDQLDKIQQLLTEVNKFRDDNTGEQ